MIRQGANENSDVMRAERIEQAAGWRSVQDEQVRSARPTVFMSLITRLEYKRFVLH